MSHTQCLTCTTALAYIVSVARKNPHAVALGRKGGIASAKVRKEKIPPEQRQEIARRAAQVRWAKAGQRKGSPG
jgi:hypothetical protein